LLPLADGSTIPRGGLTLNCTFALASGSGAPYASTSEIAMMVVPGGNLNAQRGRDADQARRGLSGLLDGHKVLYAFYSVYVVNEFGDQITFGFVFRLAAQCNHTLFGADRGIECTGRAVI